MSSIQSEIDSCVMSSEVSFAGCPLEQLVADVGRAALHSNSEATWPAGAWYHCMQAGVLRWFAPVSKGGIELGGWGWTPSERLRGLMAIASADLTTAFVLTQSVAAITRMVGSDNSLLHEQVLPDVLSGEQFTTVGISHLATSRQHLSRPVLRAEPVHGSLEAWSPEPEAYVLDGTAPWVTGVRVADVVVVGAVCDNGQEILFAVPVDLPGIHCGDGTDLMALSGSGTDQMRFNRVKVGSEWIVSGPADPAKKVTNQGGSTGGTGSLQTSALSLGLSRSAIGYLRRNCQQREELLRPTAAFEKELDKLERELLSAAEGQSPYSAMQIRSLANDLVIRSTQAALMAAKGAGFVQHHSVGRWCREAMFFLVWSCPDELAISRVCELSGAAS
ncbi:acyl-CoA dehydrogenase family protein [Aporhodopirellula aestuarii]|uniref:Acyl-CoA/acyl-ACP dehydrogenase n=1 Tax=Aporhodopirellula aestuarii TaxID=2950107 RepID=A0ABT0U2M8_9BACT|nr:acyl-CoA dehydrogenase family protein [Aporhodopirellula aestuarii]MCM2371149.1 acyl-CoA/acyl-ACP dehydrogenase [Aporhodopirellula aestuarii]